MSFELSAHGMAPPHRRSTCFSRKCHKHYCVDTVCHESKKHQTRLWLCGVMIRSLHPWIDQLPLSYRRRLELHGAASLEEDSQGKALYDLDMLFSELQSSPQRRKKHPHWCGVLPI